jgi:ABC-type Zn2+ transport system substrate-binding protein/surface adhesin
MDTFKDQNLNIISLALKERETEILSPVATLSDDGVRRFHDAHKIYRQNPGLLSDSP